MKRTPEQQARKLLVAMLGRKSLGLDDAVRALVAGAVYIGGQLETLAAAGIEQASKQVPNRFGVVIVACRSCARLDVRSRATALGPDGLRPCSVCDGEVAPLPPEVT